MFHDSLLNLLNWLVEFFELLAIVIGNVAGGIIVPFCLLFNKYLYLVDFALLRISCELIVLQLFLELIDQCFKAILRFRQQSLYCFLRLVLRKDSLWLLKTLCWVFLENVEPFFVLKVLLEILSDIFESFDSFILDLFFLFLLLFRLGLAIFVLLLGILSFISLFALLFLLVIFFFLLLFFLGVFLLFCLLCFVGLRVLSDLFSVGSHHILRVEVLDWGNFDDFYWIYLKSETKLEVSLIDVLYRIDGLPCDQL